MGVPKFYRWLSERYACLSQVVKDYQIPEFDNLYLDMNGIIHPCSHPNDNDPHFRITEEEIFSNIFHYIEVLFRIIKPQKVFFMAVDGVAPRAKMNQQRARRFRSAREAEDNIKKAEQKGEILPTKARFDSNCITPGTEFMVRLHEQLKYFVNKKITTDPGWQGLKIYLSGHETPGEGEHKIMDFIRHERSQPGYDPNTRHCLYGLDADLIVLGLTSHDPHFSLLREEVRFGKNVKRISNPEDITFHLLHLSLLREYIDLEFESLKDKISFGYDLEKIIDDWILMGFLVGNDFIPNLPNFHINHDALPYLWQVYKDIMPTLNGYLHDGGTLSLQRFEIYITTLAKFDLEKFEDTYVDLKWLEGKKAQSDEQEELSEMSEVDGSVLSTSGVLSEMSLNSKKKKKKNGKLVEYLQEKGVLDDDEDDGDFSEEHEKYKLRYYKEKFELQDDDSCEELVEQLCFKYVEAIQWILFYYFDGVSSWGWYYPFHYAPYVSDIKDFQHQTFSFNMGKPFLPFEQLLAVLPAASKKLLPEPFQSLMTQEHSPIIDYYPLKFNTDLNGKRQDWEAVVLIPFIDERRLLDAMEPLYPGLKKGEKDRNKHNPCLLYTHDPEKSEHYPSPLPEVFPDLVSCHASRETVPIDKFRLPKDEILKGLLPNVKLDVYLPGFPSLKHVPHSGELKKVGVKVFQMHSRGESMVLNIDETDELDLKEVADSLLGQTCYVGWPHLIEAFVTSVCDGSKKYLIAKDSPDNVQDVTLTASDASAWKKQVSCEKQMYLEKKAVDIGMTHILIEARQIQGKKYVCGSKGSVSLEKKWSDWAVAFPFQVTVKNIDVCDETDAGAQCETISDLFPVGTECFMVAIPHYGSAGKVLEVDSKTNRVRVQLTVVPEPDLVSLIINKEDYAESYMPAHIMAKRLGLTSHALAQITGKVLLTKGKDENSSKIDIGLNLKFSKQDKEVLGYARRNEGNWNYSPKTERTISMYQEKFPQVFDVLSRSSSEVLKVSDVFPNDEQFETLSEVEKWLKTLPSHNQKPVKCGSSTLDEPVVKQIEEAVEKLKEEKQNKKNVKVRVKPNVLYRPMKYLGQVPPDPAADFELFDRVVNVRTLGVAPYGLKGTIVGIHQGKTDSDQVNYEVLFDEPFMGGQSLRGSSAFENKLYVMPEWSLLNLSYGNRLECKKKGVPSPLEVQQKRKHDAGQHNKGRPAEYKPPTRGGAYHREFYSAWQSPPAANNDRQYTSPNGPSPRNNERFSSPHNRFSSPEFNSPGQHRRFSPRWNSPRDRGYRPLNSQISPRDSSRFYTPLNKPAFGNETDANGELSAQESERIIRRLLNLNGSPGSNPNTDSPLSTFNKPDHAFPMPPMSPTSPVSPNISSVPSGLLVLACRQNRWPTPFFSHNRIAQHFITTVWVAGTLFQGFPSLTIEESTESAAESALKGLFPNSDTMSYNGMISPFTFPLSPNTTPPHKPSTLPTNPQKLHNSCPRHDNPKKQAREITPKSTPGSQDRKSRSSKSSLSSAEGTLSTSKAGFSGVPSLFIPHQVTLKKKDLVNTPVTKTSEDVDTVEPAKPNKKDTSDNDTTAKPTFDENEVSKLDPTTKPTLGENEILKKNVIISAKINENGTSEENNAGLNFEQNESAAKKATTRSKLDDNTSFEKDKTKPNCDQNEFSSKEDTTRSMSNDDESSKNDPATKPYCDQNEIIENDIETKPNDNGNESSKKDTTSTDSILSTSTKSIPTTSTKSIPTTSTKSNLITAAKNLPATSTKSIPTKQKHTLLAPSFFTKKQ